MSCISDCHRADNDHEKIGSNSLLFVFSVLFFLQFTLLTLHQNSTAEVFLIALLLLMFDM